LSLLSFAIAIVVVVVVAAAAAFALPLVFRNQSRHWDAKLASAHGIGKGRYRQTATS
jgi:Na+/glutamate symporter